MQWWLCHLLWSAHADKAQNHDEPSIAWPGCWSVNFGEATYI